MDIGIGPSSPRGAGINMYGVRITCKDLYKYIIHYIVTLYLVILSKSFSYAIFRLQFYTARRDSTARCSIFSNIFFDTARATLLSRASSYTMLHTMLQIFHPIHFRKRIGWSSSSVTLLVTLYKWTYDATNCWVQKLQG